jgi:NAD(P)H-nitrite reductase large subunit
VVIGGGLIGISVTEALAKRGVSVSVVEMKDRILNTILDETASAIAAEAVKKAEVRVIVNQTVAEIRGENLVSGVTLDNGESIPCSLVVAAIGVVPRVDLVQGTGIELNRGIVIDRTMATSHPDVYACGDAVEAYDFTLDTNRAIPIWPSAYIGGRVAGFNMAGAASEYSGGTALNSLTYFGVDIVSAGIVVPTNDGYEALSIANGEIYKKLLLRDNVIVGMICIGDIDKAGILYSLMREKTDVGEFKHKLLDDDFGLVSLPQELWQERLGAPPLVGVVAPALPPEEEVEDYSGE